MDRDSSAGTRALRKAKAKAASSANRLGVSGSAPAGVEESPKIVRKAGRTRATAPNHRLPAKRRARDVTTWKLSASDVEAERPMAVSSGAKAPAAARRPARTGAPSGGVFASTLESVGALAELAAEASENTLAINPLIGVRGRDMTAAAASFLKAVATAPVAVASHYAHYLKALSEVAWGTSQIAPDPKDRRFADATWKDNAVYSRLMQAYLATHKELNSFVDNSKLDVKEKGKAHFIASLIA